MCSHSNPLHPIGTMGPFSTGLLKLRDVILLRLVDGHHYIIMVVDYFTKWIKTMPTLNNSGKNVVYFMFNHTKLVTTSCCLLFFGHTVPWIKQRQLYVLLISFRVKKLCCRLNLNSHH